VHFNHSFTYNASCIMFVSQNYRYKIFLQVILFSPVNNIPLTLQRNNSPTTHSQFFFSQHFSFPCQYQSTNAPYTFIYLRAVIYNVSLQGIFLSVPIHKSSIRIYLPTTQNVKYLSPSNFPLSVFFHQRSIHIHSHFTQAV